MDKSQAIRLKLQELIKSLDGFRVDSSSVPLSGRTHTEIYREHDYVGIVESGADDGEVHRLDAYEWFLDNAFCPALARTDKCVQLTALEYSEDYCVEDGEQVIDAELECDPLIVDNAKDTYWRMRVALINSN